MQAKPPLSVRTQKAHGHKNEKAHGHKNSRGSYLLIAAQSQNKHGEEQYARSQLPEYTTVAIISWVGDSQAFVPGNTCNNVEKS